ncbi:hypothetical protein PISMIDRAFT_681006 [Pisolithus microcarpus 441]|uniref:Uncharacterized protein n=1 Tax=Pisolithus microcarpus 441 TaxID=765257 RepID=A0A0C9YAX1_9AGAM|nr:hypothetical protein PISMIDRAFT_681006 [Pisolithus microcarpus 441]
MYCADEMTFCRYKRNEAVEASRERRRVLRYGNEDTTLSVTSPAFPSSLRRKALLFEGAIEGLDGSYDGVSDGEGDSKS